MKHARSDHAFRRQDACRNGEIKTRALLLDIRRGKIYGDMMPGKGVAGIFYSRLDPVPTFPHGDIGKPHRRELGQPLRGIDLDINQVGIDADYRTAKDFNNHSRSSPFYEPLCIGLFQQKTLKQKHNSLNLI